MPKPFGHQISSLALIRLATLSAQTILAAFPVAALAPRQGPPGRCRAPEPTARFQLKNLERSVVGTVGQALHSVKGVPHGDREHEQKETESFGRNGRVCRI
jgi:hypothetical protein